MEREGARAELSGEKELAHRLWPVGQGEVWWNEREEDGGRELEGYGGSYGFHGRGR